MTPLINSSLSSRSSRASLRGRYRIRGLVRGTAAMMFLLGTAGLVGVLLSEQALAAENWFLLEFADSKPPCLDAPEGSHCIGTAPKTSVFEMRDGERLEMPTGTPLPPAWMALNRMWVYAPAVDAAHRRRAIELASTPMGARLAINDGEYQYLQSVPLARWTALESPNQPKLWVRVTPYSP